MDRYIYNIYIYIYIYTLSLCNLWYIKYNKYIKMKCSHSRRKTDSKPGPVQPAVDSQNIMDLTLTLAGCLVSACHWTLGDWSRECGRCDVNYHHFKQLRPMYCEKNVWVGYAACLHILLCMYILWWYWSIAWYRHELRDSVASHSLEHASDARRVNRKRGTRDDWRYDLGVTSLFDNLEWQFYLKKSQRAHVKRTPRTHV